MKLYLHLRPFRMMLALLVAGWLVAGCVSNRATWDGRVGSYTHDQAVIELGPPDKEATLSDGSRVAEWLTMRGDHGGFVGYYGPPYARPYPYYRYYGPTAGLFYEPGSPDYWLRLTFGPDGNLTGWKKLAR